MTVRSQRSTLRGVALVALTKGFFAVALVLTATTTVAIETSGRFKVFTSATKLATTDLLNAAVEDPLSDFRLDLRLLVKHAAGPWRFEFDPTLTWTGGDAVQVLSGAGLPLDQLPGNDSQRFFNWSEELFSHEEQRMVTRADRLSVAYRQPSWSLRVGRQAISWGSGLVFQPLDLFSPFAPTTIDREFKPGVDAILFESLVGDSGELQALWIGRQPVVSNRSSHTVALKWHVGLNQLSVDAIVAEHIGDDFAGISLSVPVGGALVRMDASRLCEDETCTVNALVNVDYTVSVGQALFYVFAELYHSGFGLASATEPISAALQRRLARGEVFTLMENYGSVGANITWHPLLSQSFVVLNNLDDGSGLFQTTMNYEPSDSTRVQFGFSVPFGKQNSEFGEKEIHADMTSGGGSTWFATLSYYF